MWRKGNPHALSVRLYIGAATVENSKKVHQKIKKQKCLMIQQFHFWECIQKEKTTMLESHLHPNVHSSITYNSEDMEGT